MVWRLFRGLLGPGKSRLVARAKSGDPLSIGLVALFLLFRFAKKRSAGKVFATKLPPGGTITISSLPNLKARK